MREDLPTDYLYNLDESLIWNDGKGNIYSFRGQLYSLGKQESEVDYNSEYGLFFQTYADKSKVLVCDVWDAKSGEKKKTVEQFIGYDIEDDELKLYCNYGVEKIGLK